jgi:hypothetical protein
MFSARTRLGMVGAAAVAAVLLAACSSSKSSGSGASHTSAAPAAAGGALVSATSTPLGSIRLRLRCGVNDHRFGSLAGMLGDGCDTFRRCGVGLGSMDRGGWVEQLAAQVGE